MKHTEYQGLGESCFSAVLPSGLQLRIVPKRGFARRYAFLAVNFGAVDTAFFQNGSRRRVPDGIAHYLEHKMFDLPDRDAMELFAEYGGSPNAFTSYGLTAYYFSCTERFEDNLRLLLHMVATPHFTAESVEKERGIIAQEIRMYEDSAQSRVGEDLFAALFRSHPIRVPIAGTVESIAEITPELLLSCYRAFYRADNMMLCVVGDVDEETVYSIAEAEIAAAELRCGGDDAAGAQAVGKNDERFHADLCAGLQVRAAAAGYGHDAPRDRRRPCGRDFGGGVLTAV